MPLRQLKIEGYDKVLYWVCFFFGIGFYLTLIMPAYAIVVGYKSLDTYSYLHLISGFLNGLIYFVNGMTKFTNIVYLVDFCNLGGIVITFICISLVSYKHFMKTKWEPKKRIMAYIFFVLGFIVFTVIFSILEIIYLGNEGKDKEINTFDSTKKIVLDYIAAVFNILMYFTPGFMGMYHMIKDKSNDYVNIIAEIVGLGNAIVWLIWSVYLHIVKPEEENIHGIIANSVSIGLIVFIAVFYLINLKYEKNDEYKEKVYNLTNSDNKSKEVRTKSDNLNNLDDFY